MADEKPPVTPQDPPVSPPPPPPPPAASLAGKPADAPADPPTDKPADAPTDKPADKSKDTPPVTFEAEKITLPEGFSKDEEAFGKFQSIMADDKLSPTERGQKLIDLQAEALAKVDELNTKRWNDMQDQWAKDAKADKDIGGDKLAPTLQSISKAIDSLGSDSAKAFRDALDLTGAGNNPAIIKGMAQWAKLLTEGGHITGNPPKGAPKTLQEEFFPNSPEMKG